MQAHLYEVIKEYVLVVENLDHSVKGRITKRINAAGDSEYYWNISHFYRRTDMDEVLYYPEKKIAKTLKEAEALLLAYFENFKAIDVTPNPLY